ncbi:phosphonate transport system permease protein [Dethiosulfatibacter aminovorans DSM 17477]|uniref:Phosphonate transport system permease protein n=1 Tax=Dethiosulfatibacter aminovorans DSM 17477 TaxID=1121476 RepID=A0A1M6AZD4_9FIRM|nr:ABC transporter permease subunit [Dethiosulfatibacter aminovorans]SHI41801.1 phosphonate transport system permease protein [Dethiosulfatibacter aminovorans DSM 17477]
MNLLRVNKGTVGMSPKEFRRENKLISIMYTLGIVSLTIIASIAIEFEVFGIFSGTAKVVERITEIYLPPNFTEIDKMIEEIWVTIILSISSGVIGSIFAYMAALLVSKTTGMNRVVAFIARGLATLSRNIPGPIWAIVLLMAFWYGEFLALLVMTMMTFGLNTRIFNDMIDETSKGGILALESTGADWMQVVFQAVIPETIPSVVSWTLYAVEYNIRYATIVGMLSGGGIGYLIGIYKDFRRFDELMAAVVFIVVVIMVFDQLSIQIRKRILG